MRRVAPPSVEPGNVPRDLAQESGVRHFFDVGHGEEHQCWACPDAPCMVVPDRRSAPARAALELPVDPDRALCPVGALKRISPESQPTVDASCIGCGACVRACPVGAITLDPVTNRASIEAPESLVETAAFTSIRDARSAALRWDQPEVDALVPSFAIRIDDWLAHDMDESTARRFARAALSVEGLDPQLAIVGDNGPWPEATALVGGRLLLLEITPGVDLLDPLRRLIVAYAHVTQRLTRSGIDSVNVSLAVVSGGLPNRRTDSYRLVQDIEGYLGIDTHLLPAGALALMLTRPGQLQAWLGGPSDLDVEPADRINAALLRAGIEPSLARRFAPTK